ncbi:MAG: Hsp20/alpha crystallin family protein [Bradyrhizobium sp.]|nr:Hsp20/alpha crystallin family protein [Bradyrhizobium sp.]MDE1937043.1 Hsp20/alpha crystallin family protein [Bradyrhizobium sp.]
MAEAATKLPAKAERSPSPASPMFEWRPLENLRNQVDRLFHDFETGFRQSPLYRDVETFLPRNLAFPVTPAIDILEKDNAFELTAELPGLDAGNIELSVSDDVLTVKGEKKEEKEEKTKDRYFSERRYGSFRRSIQLPASVDSGKIEANYKSGILTVTLPKSAESQKKQTVIPITTK